MFLKSAKLKRLVKQAYKKSVLRLGDMGERLYISGSCWLITIKKEMMPKELVAMLYETAGELPEDGTSFLATEGGNQYELDRVTRMIAEIEKEHMEKAVKTNVLLESYETVYRLIQAVNSGRIMLIDEEVIDTISVAEIDYDNKETKPEGPLCNNAVAYWENNVMTFLVYAGTDEKHEELLKNLETFHLSE